MMKKTKLIIGSVLAAGLLAGGTFAAYTVTDNAGKIGVQITPGTIEEEQVGNITLEWGQNDIAKIENLSAGGEAKRKVVLKASQDYAGILQMDLTDVTVYGDNYEGAKLINYLTIDVYQGDFETKAAAAAAKASAEGMQHYQLDKDHASIAGAANGSATGETYSVFVTLSESATPVYSTIVHHQVYLQFDWNKAANDALEVDATTIYLKSGFEHPYVFAWEGSKTIGAWPGSAMTKVSDGLYSFDLPKTYSNVIFADWDGVQDVNTIPQTADLTFDHENPAAKYYVYNGGTSGYWTEAISEHQYYFTGTINGVTHWFTDAGIIENWYLDDPTAPNPNGDKAVKINYALKAGDVFKIIDVDGKYYGAPNTNGNIEITADGNYDIYLNSIGEVWVNAHA